jgi:hypothetical protein
MQPAAGGRMLDPKTREEGEDAAEDESDPE